MKILKKVEQYAALIGKVFNTLDMDSDTDAPSINAVKKVIDGIGNKALLVKDTVPTNDFNTMTDIGVYIIHNQTMANAPDEEVGTITGELTVTSNDDENNTIIYQKLETEDNYIYLRSHVGSVWNEWKRNVIKDELQEKVVIDEEGTKLPLNLVLKVTSNSLIKDGD